MPPGETQNFYITSQRNTDMHSDPNKRPSPICDFLPGYSSYEGIGGIAAGGFSSLVEMIIRLFTSLRR